MRLHGIDENHAGEVAELLAYFRSLQRQLDLSVLLVHHTRKNAAGGAAAGQGLRGSGDIHAFGDSNLYLRRTREHLVLSSEHRAAPAAASVYSGAGRDRRGDDPPGGHRGTAGRFDQAHQDGKRRSLEERVLDLLGQGVTVTRAKLRDSLGVKNERSGRGAGVAGASRPALPHARWLATPGIDRRWRAVPVPHREMRGNGTVESQLRA